MLKAVKIQLDPSPRQERLLRGAAGAARFAFNACLAHVKAQLDVDERPDWSFYALRKWWNAHKNTLAVNKTTGVPWWGEYSKEAFAYGVESLAGGLKNYTASKQGKRVGRKVGFPRFKSKHSALKFAYTTGSFGMIADDPHGLRLPRIGRVHTMENVTQRVGTGRVVRMTISERAGCWYAALTIETEEPDTPRKQKRDSVGVDLGVTALATLSDGTKIANPKRLQHAERKLKHLQRELSRKQKGSHRREQARRKLARQHAKVADARMDGLHKLTTMLASVYAVVCIEDLNVQGMMHNHHLAKSIADASFFEFRRQLVYKTVKYGSRLRVVDRYYPSSKTCSICGMVKAKLSLNEREYHCQQCGLVIDRDLNAAININVVGSAPKTLNAHGGDISPTATHGGGRQLQ